MAMSIDDLDFDDEEEIDNDILEICFPIYHLPVDCDDLFDSGTGFLINNNGIFLSAGHNFSKEIGTYIAYYGDNKYKIKCIYKEHDDSGKDLFIGELIDFNGRLPFHVTLANSDSIENGTDLNFAGFNTQMIVPRETMTTGIKIQDSEYTFYGHVLTAKLVFPEKKERYRIIGDKRLTLPFMKVLSNTTSPLYRGISGGPVFFEKRIYGVFLSDVFVTSNYIRDCLKKVGTK